MVLRKRWHAIASTAATLAYRTNAYLMMEWNQEATFGPDGPWQAVQLGYQYSYGGTVNPISLYPALRNPYAAAYVPTPQSCAGSTGENCAAGGTVLPLSNATGLTWIASNDYQNGWSYNFTGTYRTVNLTLPESYTQHSALLVACSNTTIAYHNGRTAPAQLGFYSLGGGYVAEDASTPSSLYQPDVTQSNSFGLHYGSGVLQYPGSLVFGGYDTSRMIGPLVSFTAGGSNTVQLLDVTIGVETGGSPFAFASKTGLLQQSSTTPGPQPLQASPLPNVPYIAMPQATVEGITKLLPVTLDDSGYYLWDTTDPLYSKIVSSPAYLGFVFPVSPGSSTQTTIKIPFSLLNLTLEPSITGYDTNRPYLPIIPVDDTSLVQQIVWLGRAFFQGAYYAANWGNNASWLAQAPGPGANKNGLGTIPQDMVNTATTLSIQSGDDLFQQSWADTWTVLPGSTSASPGASSSATSKSSGGGGGLSGGAIAGIVVGVVLGLGLIAGVAVFLIRRRRVQYRATPTEAPGDQPAPMAGPAAQHNYDAEMAKYGHNPQMMANSPQWSPARFSSPPYDAGAYHIPSELAAPEHNGAKELHSQSRLPHELPAGDAGQR